MTKPSVKESEESLSFSADVSRLLDIVAHALYSNRDVFLRELISNAADACDRLRYEVLSAPALIGDDPIFKIHVTKDTAARTLTVLDTGTGMTREELIDNLGTIAKSGTRNLMEQVRTQDETLSLIGQFGVGFYAGFMVAAKIEVVSRRAGQTQTWHWESDGRTGFSVREATLAEAAILKAGRGTAVILHLIDDASDYLMEQKLEEVIKTYSDHIGFPIYLGDFPEPVNKASALWTRSKSEITEDQYTEFYRHIGIGMDNPLLTHHWQAEGKISYSALLFTPTLRPWDLYDPTRKHAVRLYVKRVFISADCEGLVYPWLRFLRGVIDSEDLPLNISREMLQHNPVITKIRAGVGTRVLKDLDKLSQDDPVTFATFWGQFGAVLKEGLYDAPEHREALLTVARFYSTAEDGLTSLSDYVSRMKDGQKEIYYMSGENLETLKNAPQLEGFKERGLEVLFFTDTIDDFWLQSVPDFDGHAFRSVTKGAIDLSAIDGGGDAAQDNKAEDAAVSPDLERLREQIESILAQEIEAVRFSARLTGSPVCLVAAAGAVDMHMERVLKIHQNYSPQSQRVLELNPKHPLIAKLAALPEGSASESDETLAKAAHLLLDQARIIQGEPVANPARFAQDMAVFMTRGL
ncbi:MAG: molecular chaperone HtpG [Alphaproteobacteria bacterium]|nr:molecular chaperone HtpG [Alphaproteobacteria bacterium]